ncbi:maleylpyruvate isomerase family mycothiol-dependent enzyme [Pseudonocardia sp.]|uniref:maleylpyruvate isomerase family mycothiol-dependent enzyme n=1 Tax=Pseudonocardia sp. TaxID=60912 RepID=UPI002636C95A|nr:maleylpyruvate isomerase family mycothiol-dependent enzyme [Pseudonocardia sp.]
MDHSAALLRENDRLVTLIRDAPSDTPVPTCPGWTLRNLVTHVGRGDRWAATIARERSTGPVDIRTVADGKPPADAAQWLADGARLLLDGVASAGPDTPVWTFTGPQPASWWIRRRLHECAVHRADTALALGEPYTPEPEQAADGVSEWLTLLAARPAAAGPPPLEDGSTLHLHATDDGLGEAGEWMIRTADGRVSWEHGHAKGTTAVRGPATDLLLALTRRIPADRVQVLGDASAFDTWLDRTGF